MVETSDFAFYHMFFKVFLPLGIFTYYLFSSLLKPHILTQHSAMDGCRFNQSLLMMVIFEGFPCIELLSLCSLQLIESSYRLNI